MVLLGDEASAGIFRCLPDDEVQEISREISKLGQIDPQTADSVIEDFYRLLLAQSFLERGGPEQAQRILAKAFGLDLTRNLLDSLDALTHRPRVAFDRLQKADPVQLSRFIQSEQPQTIALVLAHLDSSQAAALLSSLPADVRADVVMRMAALEHISPDVIGKITSILEQKLKSLGDNGRESCGGVRAVAELINRMESRSAAAILEKIAGADPSLASSIRNLMFAFEDVLLLDDDEMREILQRVDVKTLALALKGTSEELKDRFFRSMSARAAETVKGDIEILGPVKIREVEAAQQQIVSVIRMLDDSGIIALKGDSGDQYVE
jgi:flagellar motor switch protein FliG